MPTVVNAIDVLRVEKVERIPSFRLDKLDPVTVEKLRKLFCVVTDRLEIDVESANSVLEKLYALAVERKNQELEIPFSMRNPTELMPDISVETVVEILEPVVVLSTKKLYVV
jgi:hypothetical protein